MQHPFADALAKTREPLIEEYMQRPAAVGKIKEEMLIFLTA
jgi:hypothetical protein